MESLLADESLSESSTEDSNQGNEEERLENRNLRANVKNEHDTLRNQQHNANESRGRIDAPFYVSGIQVPQSCSLCTFNKIKFSIETTNRGVNLDSTYFTYAPHLNPKDPNGLWLKFSTQTAFGKDILLLIELYERNASSGPSPNDAKVQFCRGKCGTKKSEIVSLNETKLVRENGAFEATVAINEQCAHRSKNGYGSPDTLFYFRMQLGEVKNNQFVPFSQFNSTLIKVVAPGKNKGPHPPASVPAKTKVPTVGMKTVTQKKNKAPKIQISQLIESMGMTIQQLTDRVVALENRVNLQDHLLQSVGLNASHLKGEMIPISQNCKMEPYHHPVSSPQYCNPDANSKDHGEPSSCAYAGLRQSGEFSYDSFLNLSTDNSMFNLMRSD